MSLYLVTGVAGFIGSAVATSLLKAGHEVVGVDNLSTGKEQNIPQGVQFIKGECQNPTLYTTLLPQKKYDAIFHIAGQSSGEISFDDPLYDLQTNTESTLLLLNFAHKVGCSRLVYASSMSVYGKQDDKPIVEETLPNPLSFYGVGKLASEHYLRLYEKIGISSTALRLFNVYGPGQNMENMRQGMVSIFMNMMHNNGHIHSKGSPNRFRDFVYIDDVVSAFLACLERPQSGGQVINIGTGYRVSVDELMENICALTAKPTTVEYSGATAGDMFGIFPDISMAAKYLAYEPTVLLPEGLKRMYDWYKNKN